MNDSIGVGRNPWKSWLILAGGFVALQAAVPLAEFASVELWRGNWVMQQSLLNGGYGDGQPHSVELVYYTFHYAFLYVMPFLFLILAMLRHLTPYMAIPFAVLNTIFLCALESLLGHDWNIYGPMTAMVIAGYFFGIIGFVVLKLFRSRVMKVQPEEIDDRHY